MGGTAGAGVASWLCLAPPCVLAAAQSGCPGFTSTVDMSPGAANSQLWTHASWLNNTCARISQG